MQREDYLEMRAQLDFAKKTGPLLGAVVLNIILFSLFCVAGWQVPHSRYLLFLAPLVTVFMCRSFSLMHDASHGLLSDDRVINDVLGVLSGACCFLPFHQWRQSHSQHHYWSGNVTKDPVMGFLVAYPKISSGIKRGLDFFWMNWVPSLAVVQNGVFWILSIAIFRKKTKNLKSFVSIAVPIGLFALIIGFATKEFILYAFLPGVFGYLLMVEIVNFPHHLQTETISGEDHLPVWQQFSTARSCHYDPWMARWVVLNFNLHVEHHMFPDLPWYSLQDATPLVRSHLGKSYRMDPQFQWILQNRQRGLQEVLYGAAVVDRPSDQTGDQTKPIDKAS